MDDDLPEFEAELKRLRPAAPTARLLMRLERELAEAPGRTAPGWWIRGGVLSIAAASAAMVAVVLTRDSVHRPSASVHEADAVAPAAFKPVAAENLLYAARDEGFVTLADGTPARRERLSYLDTIIWKDPRTNASVRWTVPREEVRVVPVNFQ